MGYATSSSNTLPLPQSPRSPPRAAYPLVRANGFKYLPEIVTTSPLDSLSSYPLLHSKVLALDNKHNDIDEDLVATNIAAFAHLTNIPFRYPQVLMTILEDEGEAAM
jgi:hypothetical protein